jgi:ribosomal protein S18 acetylase RimI-like enzyme
MKGIVVRPAKKKDLAEAFRVFESILGKLPYYNKEAKTEEKKRYSRKSLESMLKRYPKSIIIALKNGGIVGLCFVHKNAGTCYLDWIIVKPEYRDGEVGTSLIRHVLENAVNQGFHKVWCASRTTNKIAETFLQKNGFRKFAHVKRHWYRQDFFLWERFIQAGKK